MKKLLLFLTVLAVGIAGCKKDKKELLATVSTSAATGITGSVANVGGNVSSDGGTSITQRGICFATHSSPTIADSVRKNTSGTTGAFSVSLTGLNANTVYYARAFAVNATGTAYGNEVTFTTQFGLPTLTTTPVDLTNYKGGGTIVNNGGAAITASGVCWSTSPHPTIADVHVSGATATGTFTSMLLLVPNTVYYYRAYATNNFGTAYGNELNTNSGTGDAVQDIDGNIYQTVTIGSQVWMTSNLKVTHYQNGDPITNGLTGFDWVASVSGPTFTGAYTFPNADTTNKSAYGLLYNNAAVNDTRNIAPKGWHVATEQEWEIMEFTEGAPATDTATYGIHANSPIISKLLPGGSSGLNLQLAGEMAINASGNGYSDFKNQGRYWTTPGYNYGAIYNYGYYLPASVDYPNSLGRGVGYQDTESVRCVKN